MSLNSQTQAFHSTNQSVARGQVRSSISDKVGRLAVLTFSLSGILGAGIGITSAAFLKVRLFPFVTLGLNSMILFIIFSRGLIILFGIVWFSR